MAQTENVFPIWADLSSPDSVFRQVVSNRRSYSQFNIRGFAAAGWQDAHEGDSASSSAMFAALASHFVATAGCAHLPLRRVLSRAYRPSRRAKKSLGSHPTTSRRRRWPGKDREEKHGRLNAHPFRHAPERPHPASELASGSDVGDACELSLLGEVLAPLDEPLHAGCRMVRYR